MRVPNGYRLVNGAPPADDYLFLRERAGLSAKTREQAVAALPGSWAACHVVQESTGQRVGLGDAILSTLLDRIRMHAPAGAYVTLLADPPGRRLYQRHGFVDTAPGSIGMAVRLGKTSIADER